MKKIVLHIGSGKTGSSSIQKALVKCVARSKASFTFPALAGSKSNQTFRFAFCKLNETTINVRQKFSHDRNTSGFQAYQEELKDAFTEQVVDSEVVVVSSEFLFLSSIGEVAEIDSFLKSLGFSEIHVVVYLRDPANYYLSVAQQALKNQHQMPSPDGFRLEMRSAIANWTSIHPASMNIKEFDKYLLEDGNVVSDFRKYLSSVGVYAELDMATVSNETLSVEATQALQDYHYNARGTVKTIRQQQDHVHRAREFIKKNPVGTKPILKKDISAHIYRRFEKEVLQMNARYGIFGGLAGRIGGISEMPVTEIVAAKKFKDIVVGFDHETYDLVKEKI